MNIHDNILATIGRTPMVRLHKFEAARGLRAMIAAKVEAFNPGGSVKDRAALAMIEAAERCGTLHPGGTIIEPTSGNTGIGLALAGAVRGYRVVLVMPDTMSIERRKLAAAFGAEIVLTPGAEGMSGAIRYAATLHAATPNSIIPQQFDNPANPAVHVTTTGEEIWHDTDGRVAVFVATVGSGGTLSGVARALKGHDPAVRIVAVEPATSAVISGRTPAGPHRIQGIGAGFIPRNLDLTVVDEILTVTDEEAFAAARALAREDGILAGISSGAAVAAAAEVAARPELAGRLVVTLLPDTGERYLSTELFGRP